MRIKCLSTETEGPNATIAMESGDHVTLAFTDLNRKSRMIHVSIQGKVMVVHEDTTQSYMLVHSSGVNLQRDP